MKFSNDIQNTIYAEYLNIPADYYQDKIRFFERNEKRMGLLPPDIFLMIKIDYLRSLFRVREYDQFIFIVDGALESIIIDNPKIPGLKEIFMDLLQKKSMALHFNMEYEKAEIVLKELVRMKPSAFNRRLYVKNFRDRQRRDAQGFRGVIIGLVFLSGIIIGIELLVVRTLIPSWTNYVEWMRNASFIIAVSLFLVQEIGFLGRALNSLRSVLKKP